VLTERSTIVAVASPPGAGARGLLRLSGDRSAELVRRTTGLALGPRRSLALVRFDDGVGTQPCLVLWMPAPRSYTREDVAELHLPGAAPLVQAALDRLIALGARAAAPGEFTRRAFLNGRIDLTRAEGVLALVEAQNDEERRAASELLSGGLDRRLALSRERLENLRALCEASLDFDESDTGHVSASELAASLERARSALEEAAGWEERRAEASGRARVLLCGAPNAGKSALFNALTGSRALVSPSAGTTRDVLSAVWDVGAEHVTLVDAAGLGGPGEGPDEVAQEHARRELEHATLLLWVADAARAAPVLPDLHAVRPCILVWSQVDRPMARVEPARALLEALRASTWVATSATRPSGLAALAGAVREALGRRPAGLPRELQARHRAALAGAQVELERAERGLALGQPLDQIAEDLKASTAALDALSGRSTPEDLLERIFARFCIGK
jgi:tRNA modification GTPase